MRADSTEEKQSKSEPGSEAMLPSFESITPPPIIPAESDGSPAKVFIWISLGTNHALVRKSIPMRIEFFLRNDFFSAQSKLPTIRGNEIHMDVLSLHPAFESLTERKVLYLRETWVTAISVPKSGDFPLEVERDCFWNRLAWGSFEPNHLFAQPEAIEGIIASNQLYLHIESPK